MAKRIAPSNVARVLSGVEASSLDSTTGRSVGQILAHSGTADVVDGHLGTIVESGDIEFTSAPKDITKMILNARGVGATLGRI